MTLGAVLTNYAPQKSKDVFGLVGNFTPPIYILFFVLFGAKLNLGYMTLFMGLLAVVYLIGRTSGKMIGSYLGARLSGAVPSIRKYLPACLFSQAGVAIGLSILAGQRFENEIGNMILVVITTTTFVVQIIGPPCTKWAVVKAGEVGRDITEEDLIQKSKVSEIMDTDMPLINGHTPLHDVLRIFSDHVNLYYPVVDSERLLLGVITIDTIKNTFMVSDLQGILLAYDLMEPVAAVAHPNMPISEVKHLLDTHAQDYLPVLEDGKLVGFLEARMIQKLVMEKLLRIQAEAEVEA